MSKDDFVATLGELGKIKTFVVIYVIIDTSVQLNFLQLILKGKFKLSGLFTYIINSLRGQEKISDERFVCQYSADDTKHIECGPAQLAVMFDDSHETVCDNRNINLYPHSVLCIAPEGRDA